MMKFREKWFWALCLAVLVHVGVFFVFYLNTHQTDSVEVADSQTNTTKPAAINNVDLPEKIYTTTVTSTKTSNDTNNNVEDTVNKKSEIGNEPETSQLISSDEQTASVESRKAPSSPATNNVNDKPKKPASTSIESSQANKTPPQNEKIPNVQTDSNTQSIVASTDDKLEDIKNNASLLDIDVPAQKSNVKIDKDYLSAKSEVEAINDQLSSAINEVKKRNQQKIDEQQQLRNEANSQRLPESSN
ncbi:hypothetical protein [Psychrobacter sp. P11G3]|uniref:hypothetical protein n=1 Tax=Psychrobacter sp. P11G3 TaxID=1699623 RepID=UPI00070FD400|nr:hypothetical protein [Psychrobacter sp. P11G3]KRG37032.1 hypothetical protein AK824_08180 [Psychrobacter sp. P11G3]